LGPLLFLLYVNDLDTVCSLESHLKLFADDCKLFSETNNRSNRTLQQCIDAICSWARVWQLQININKCQVITITSSHAPVISHSYYINNVCISSSDNVSDLGILISNDLSYKSHIQHIVSKAYQRISILFRGFVTRDIVFMRKAYITYIRPLLEYNSTVWAPTEIYLIDLIEKVQRYFTRNIPVLAERSYKDRLSVLNIDYLELRRLHCDLTYYFKIFNHLTPHNPADFFMIYHPPLSSRSISSYLIKPTKCSNKLESFLSFRSINAWNYIPDYAKSVNSVQSFKKHLKCIDFNKFLFGNAIDK